MPGSEEETRLIDSRAKILQKLKNRRLKRQRENEDSDGDGDGKKKRKTRQRLHLNMLGFSEQEDRPETTDEEDLLGEGPNEFHKTRPCYAYADGRCDKGRNCPYAHTDRELKAVGQARAEWQEKL